MHLKVLEITNLTLWARIQTGVLFSGCFLGYLNSLLLNAEIAETNAERLIQ
jgi:hypothetical protein